MVFEHIEKLKREYTDKYVAIANMVPELKRFEGRTGVVRTVNMSGRALVEFLGSNDVSWYDIDVDFLKIVSPPEAASEKKAADKSASSAAPAQKKPATSTADILAMARGKAKPQPAEAKSADAKPNTADILAMARGKGSASKEKTPPAQPKDSKSLSTAEKLALLRGEAKPPAEEAKKESDPPQKPSTADILAMARGKKAAAEKTEKKATSPKKPSTADILAMARGKKKKPDEKPSPEPDQENPSES